MEYSIYVLAILVLFLAACSESKPGQYPASQFIMGGSWLSESKKEF